MLRTGVVTVLPTHQGKRVGGLSFGVLFCICTVCCRCCILEIMCYVLPWFVLLLFLTGAVKIWYERKWVLATRWCTLWYSIVHCNTEFRKGDGVFWYLVFTTKCRVGQQGLFASDNWNQEWLLQHVQIEPQLMLPIEAVAGLFCWALAVTAGSDRWALGVSNISSHAGAVTGCLTD
jgi:hypothetical protein